MEGRQGVGSEALEVEAKGQPSSRHLLWPLTFKSASLRTWLLRLL